MFAETRGGCEIFSVVGPRYSPLDIDVIATQVHQIVPKDARAEVLYDGYRARLSVLFHSNIQPEHCVAGEIFKAGVSITTADDGTGAIRIAAQVWRNLCRNLIIVDLSQQTMAVRHVGPNLGNVVSSGPQEGLPLGELEGRRRPRRQSLRGSHARTPERSCPRPRSRTCSSATS